MKTKHIPTVYVMLSGGVDSAVAAALLVKEGYAVRGIFMVNWTVPLRHDAPCTWEQDWRDVQAVGAALRIPVEKVNFETQYHARVIDIFFREYARGRTPNPDVLCNQEIKFGLFLTWAQKAGAHYVASGHYARVAHSGGLNYLKKGVDPAKDQSYFLWTLGQPELARTLFPLGEYTKQDVRTLARELGLPVANKPDSQGICFVGKVDLPSFLETRLALKAGDVVTTEGKRVGRHQGVQFFTEGQRHGFGGGGSVPFYVVRKDLQKNELIVAAGADHPALFAQELEMEEVRFVARTLKAGAQITCRIRYRQPDQTAVFMGKRAGGKTRIRFHEPQRSITPGQSCVLYQKDELVGGGIITRALSVKPQFEKTKGMIRLIS